MIESGMGESITTSPSSLENYYDRKAENLRLENHIIGKLLNSEPATVYHQVHDEADIEGIQASGIKGNYKILLGEETKYLAYFTLLFPTKLDGRQVAYTLNNNEDKKFKIFDGRIGERVPYKTLIQQGYDGLVQGPGVFVPLDQNFMLTLFDGASLAGKFEKVS